jgi:hypothetical protein
VAVDIVEQVKRDSPLVHYGIVESIPVRGHDIERWNADHRLASKRSWLFM